MTGMHGRAVSGLVKKLGLDASVVVDDLAASVGQSGTARPLLVLAGALESLAAEHAPAGTTVVAMHLADGADAVVLRTTEALAGWRPVRSVAEQVANGAALSYSKFLAWRGSCSLSRPDGPSRHGCRAVRRYRNEEWKFGFVGSKDRSSGAVHLPPSRMSMEGGAVDDMEPVAMADATGTVDHVDDRSPGLFAQPAHRVRRGGLRRGRAVSRSSSPTPTPRKSRAGSRVEMTFRRLFSADGIHDYFWKARPVRTGGEA